MLMKVLTKYFWWLGGAILVLAALPRAIELINHNYLFGFDQGEHFMAVKRIVIDGKPTLIGTESGGIGGLFQGPGWYWLLAIPFAVSRGDPYAAMVLMFLLSLVVILLPILAFKKSPGAIVAILVAWVLALSPELTKHARFIWPPFVIPSLTSLVLVCLWQGINGKKYYFPMATFLVGSMYHFEVATAATLLLALALYAPLAWRRRIIDGKILIAAGCSALFSFLPMLLFDLRHDFLNTRGIVNLFVSKNLPPFSYENILANHREIFSRIVSQTLPIPPEALGALILLMVVGWCLYLRNQRIPHTQRAYVFFLGTFPVALFAVFLFYRNHLWEWWLYDVSVILSFLVGFLLAFWLREKRWIWAAVAVLLLFFSTYAKKTAEFYSYDIRDYGGVHKIKGKLAALDTIYQDAGSIPFGLLVFTPPIYTWAYDYLTWWYGQRKYQYVPYQDKRGTVYLLIEPDNEKPWRHQGWLETVIKDGEVIWTKELPSGFILEKRVFPST